MPESSPWSRDVFEQDEDPPASAEWEIDCTSIGPVANPHYLLAVRHRSGRSSRVLMTTYDPQRVAEVEGAARRALESLRSSDFAALLKLPSPDETRQDAPDKLP